MHYLFVAKPADHKYMMEWIDALKELNHIEYNGDKGRRIVYEWFNHVPLNGKETSIHTNFLRCSIIKTDTSGNEKVTYKNSWVTDIAITKGNIEILNYW